MMQKEVASRIINKHDIETNWNKATTFIPKQGEMIIYDIDDLHDYERFKIGDGKTIVSSLPFVTYSRPEIDQAVSTITDHISNTSNPHGVTATQVGALPTTGGTLTGILYTTAPTPFLIGKNGKVGLRAATDENNNVGQINISNAWYTDGDQWGAQMSALNGKTGKRNGLRVSHNGLEYEDEDEVVHKVIHDGNIDDYTAHLASTSSVNTNIATHNTSTSAHADIRGLITELTVKLTNFLDVDDATVDQLSEIITLINNNKGTLESLTTSKINVSDIINNLTTNSDSKVLSAAQGVVIKTLIDALQTELDAHTSNKSNPHEVTKAQIGLGNVDNTSDANKPISTAM